jgi:putative acetyltransferase
MAIRQAGEGDVEAIAALLEEAFGRPDEARLFRGLWGSEDMAIALVNETDAGEKEGGEADGEIAAVAVLSHLPAPPDCLGLGPLAVARERRDRGFGKALIGESVDWARRAGHAAIFVLGQPPYYERFGFSVEAARPFASPYPANHMMALEVRPGALAGALANGDSELRYPPAFAALG